MQLKALTPRLALNKAFLKVKPNRIEIEKFKANLIELLDQINEKESEEHHKNIIVKFLDKTYYGGRHYLNTKGRNDLVIHLEKDSKSPVGVIIETKKPTNKNEMVGLDRLNVKAFQELVLYYMRERLTEGNLKVRHLVITNIYEWFFFDVDIFEKAFVEDKQFVADFVDFDGKRLAGKKTDFFYKEIAEPAVEKLLSGNSKAGKNLEFTYLDMREFENVLRNNNKSDDSRLIALFKLLSPEHLLKLPFHNDSNTLDKGFYTELLHIIGLTELKIGGKKVIDRKVPTDRNEGSLLENTILQLDSLDKISRLDKPSAFGKSMPERYFVVSLELVITWINRILFLKLLEAQLIRYNKGDMGYSFLNNGLIKSFDDLNSLFFQVLAKQVSDRTQSVKLVFGKVPYLNSSLFEPTDLEHACLFISQLQDNKTLPILSTTVLKDATGKRRAGNLNVLEYLFSFLEAYDFSSDGAEEIQEENKTLINASVLGLIFEKINGYKDGSFFTPGFITMYMCKETIQKSALQKFNLIKGWNCQTTADLYNKISDKMEANVILNNLKICDPAVGSGHFLVSALNEMIALKSELKILIDKDGKSLRDYKIEVSNDELVITDDDGRLFEYNPHSKESQRVQETIFHEKQTIIENCLFGVDINTNSVKICRLRLWIELLKNAYYKNAGGSTDLETLPNIDINIKCGNSLISRYPLDIDLSQALKKSKTTIKSYRDTVQNYRHAVTKDEKRQMEQLITSIKSNFRTEISNNDPLIKRLSSKRGDLINFSNQHSLFEQSKSEKLAQAKVINKLRSEVDELEKLIEEIRSNKVFENAFEWRFEFPEVLDDNGNFNGFDVIIGNPPYIRIQDLIANDETVVGYYNDKFITTGSGNYDLYIPFIEQGYNLLNSTGDFCYIMPHKFTNAGYGEKIRKFITDRNFLWRYIHFGTMQVFEDATTYTGLFFMSKTLPKALEFFECTDFDCLGQNIPMVFQTAPSNAISEREWVFLSGGDAALLDKLKTEFQTLEDVTERIYQGLKTSADKIYVLEKIGEGSKTFDVYCRQNDRKYTLEKDILFPLIKGGNSRDYLITPTDLLILFPYSNGQLIKGSELAKVAPKTWEYLKDHKGYLESRESGKFAGEKWYQYGRSQALDLIHQPKIFTPDIAPEPRFCYDVTGEFLFTGGVSGGYGILPKNGVSSYALLAILNSRISAWYIAKTSTKMRGDWNSFESRFIKSIPIPNMEGLSQSFDEKVKELVNLKASDSIQEADRLKAEIDKEICNLYILSEEEILFLS